jgi:predicted DNA-binding protein with PD1-like motif
VLDFPLETGCSLNEAVTRPLLESGFDTAVLTLRGGRLAPFSYVLPALSPDVSHAAYYSQTFALASAQVEIAQATCGTRDGAPFIHCHAVWVEPDGTRRAGHVLPEQTVVGSTVEARAWVSVEIAIRAEPDLETNFTLFRPVHLASAAAMSGPRMAFARIRPDQDATEALEAVCREHGFRAAIVRSSVGSLIGAEFEDGRMVEDIATEFLVLDGAAAPDEAGEMRGFLDVAVADMQGRLHEGRLLRGRNPVCITFELAIEEVMPTALQER